MITTHSVRPSFVGAQVTPAGVQYRVWAPDQESLHVAILFPAAREVTLDRDEDGYWNGLDSAGKPGDRYRYVLSDGRALPDPASRFQPEGVHGPSACVDPRAYRWQALNWKRPRWDGPVIYEIHVGTFTEAGTFLSAIERLDHVRDLGVDAIELMPLGDFPGDRNWGYDGVALYAPARCYGRPDELRMLVDAAHERGLAVILDVVYNHVGPIGNYLPAYSADYFHREDETPWGTAFNLDGPRSRPVRDHLLGNAAYWLDDFRIDGLRVDATHAVVDRSSPHFLAELAALVHDRGGFLIAEDDRNTPELLHGPDGAGHQFDAAWSDDFHHQVRVALTRTREGYFGSYGGTAAELASTLDHGWTYRGQRYPFWRGRARGAPCRHLPTNAFVTCIENHDQVGNRARGERLEHLVTPREFCAATMLLCFAPYAPMVFMGQEWAASSPFLFFTDHGEEHGRMVLPGRIKELGAAGLTAGLDPPADPEDEDSFQRSKLDWSQVDSCVLAFYRACLAERRQHLPAPARERAAWVAGALADALVLRYFQDGGDRALVFSAQAMTLPVGGQCILSLPPASEWRVVLDSEMLAVPEADRRPWTWEFKRTGAVWLHAVPRGGRPCL